MKIPALLLLLPFVVATPSPLLAQDDNRNQNQTDRNEPEEESDEGENASAEEQDNSRRIWEAKLPGGDYAVALDRISSVSIHQYVLNTQLLVNEVVVDTNGRALARFYHVAHVADGAGSATAGGIVEKGRQVLDRAGQRANTNVHNLPQKDYPATSHAGMIEFRILNLSDLKALHRSIQSAWEDGKGKTLTIR